MNNTSSFPYKKIVFFGDSFTEGEDSGGPGITDPTKSYPYILSTALNVEHENLGIRGNSNDVMFYQMLDYVYKNKDKLSDTLFLVGVSMVARTSSSSFEFIKDRGSDFDSNYIFKNPVPFKTLSPSFEVFNNHERNKLNHLLVDEPDENHILKTYTTLLAMIGLCHIHKIDIYFIDVILNLESLSTSHGISFSMIEKYFLNNLSIFNMIRYTTHNFISASQHFTADGYAIFANYVYDLLTEKLKIDN